LSGWWNLFSGFIYMKPAWCTSMMWSLPARQARSSFTACERFSGGYKTPISHWTLQSANCSRRGYNTSGISYCWKVWL
jgi:hypothetical protein